MSGEAEDEEVRLYDAGTQSPFDAPPEQRRSGRAPPPAQPPEGTASSEDAFEAFNRVCGERVGELLGKMDDDLFAASDAAVGVARRQGEAVRAGPAAGTLSQGQPRPDLEWVAPPGAETSDGPGGSAAFMRVRGQQLQPSAGAGSAGAEASDGSFEDEEAVYAEQWDETPPPADRGLMDDDALEMAVAARAPGHALPSPSLPLEELGYSRGTVIPPLAMPSVLRGVGGEAGTDPSRRASAKRTSGGVRFQDDLEEVHEIPHDGRSGGGYHARSSWAGSHEGTGGASSSARGSDSGLPVRQPGQRYGSADWSGGGARHSGGRGGHHRTSSVTDMAPLLTFSLQAGMTGAGASTAPRAVGMPALSGHGRKLAPGLAGSGPALRSVATLATAPPPRALSAAAAAAAAAAAQPPYMMTGRLSSAGPFSPRDHQLRVKSRGDHDATWGPWDDDAAPRGSPPKAASPTRDGGGASPRGQPADAPPASTSGAYPGFVLPQDAVWLAGIAELRASLATGTRAALLPEVQQLPPAVLAGAPQPHFRAAAAPGAASAGVAHSPSSLSAAGTASLWPKHAPHEPSPAPAFRGLGLGGLAVEGAHCSGVGSTSGASPAHAPTSSSGAGGRLVTGTITVPPVGTAGSSPLPSPAHAPAGLTGTAVVPPPPPAAVASPPVLRTASILPPQPPSSTSLLLLGQQPPPPPHATSGLSPSSGGGGSTSVQLMPPTSPMRLLSVAGLVNPAKPKQSSGPSAGGDAHSADKRKGGSHGQASAGARPAATGGRGAGTTRGPSAPTPGAPSGGLVLFGVRGHGVK